MYGRAVVATEYQSSLMLVRYKNTLDPAAQCNAKTPKPQNPKTP